MAGEEEKQKHLSFARSLPKCLQQWGQARLQPGAGTFLPAARVGGGEPKYLGHFV